MRDMLWTILNFICLVGITASDCVGLIPIVAILVIWVKTYVIWNILFQGSRGKGIVWVEPSLVEEPARKNGVLGKVVSITTITIVLPGYVTIPIPVVNEPPVVRLFPIVSEQRLTRVKTFFKPRLVER